MKVDAATGTFLNSTGHRTVWVTPEVIQQLAQPAPEGYAPVALFETTAEAGLKDGAIVVVRAAGSQWCLLARVTLQPGDCGRLLGELKPITAAIKDA